MALRLQGSWKTMSFNSKVVRFNATVAPKTVMFAAVFQFQSGAIQCNPSNQDRKRDKVSIPKWCDSMKTGLCKEAHLFCFNSKVVRFNAARPKSPCTTWYHVSIPKWCDSMHIWPCCFVARPPFQFQSGAIQCLLNNKEVDFNKVSIPKWCDSMCYSLPSVNLPTSVSIPKWCDSM